MDERIVVSVKPTDRKHKIYIFSLKEEKVPVTLEATIDDLYSAVTMSAAKYKINDIYLTGPTAYTLGVKERLIEKINTCFGCNNDVTVSLMNKGENK